MKDILLYCLILGLGIISSILFFRIKQLNKVNKDISEDIKNIKREHHLYKNILKTVPEPVFVHSKLEFVFANEAGLRMFGLDKLEDIIGKNVTDFIKLNMDIVGNSRIENAMSNNYFDPLVEEFLISKEGKIIAVDLLSVPMEFEDKIVVLNASKDISRREQLEELKVKVSEEKKRVEEIIEYDKLKTEFFANLSHELRTPLTLILGIVNLLETTWRDSVIDNWESSMEKKIKILKQNCYRLLRLVNNLIDITKMDSGYFEVDFQECNIINVVEDITMSCVEHIENRGIEIEFDTEIEERMMVCDPEKIERIVLNLLSNAIKFTPRGGKIAVNVLNGRDEISISIKDTGLGIPKDKIKSIFERFIQIDKSFTRSNEGSGIGLSIVKSLVDMHNGSIRVNSEYGEGSEFIITLPTTLEKENKDTIILNNNNWAERIHIEFSDIYN